MFAARLLALLLPLGIWLVQSTTTPRSYESRLAAGGFIACGVSLMTFLLFGFALMFGGIGAINADPALSQYVSFLTFPFASQTWGIVGLRGFGLTDASSAALDVFINYVPLVATVSIVVASTQVRRAIGLLNIALASFVGTITFSVVGFWLWGGGWLAMLGANLNLGHGAIDFGGLPTVALVAGCAGLVWLYINRNDSESAPAALQSYHPSRGMVGIIFMLVGVCGFFIGNPLFASISADSQSLYAINAMVASFLAGGLAIGYSIVALRRPDMLLAGRAVFAALTMTAAGSVFYSTTIAVITGLLGAVVAIAGVYYASTVLRIREEYGFAVTSILSGALGFVLVGFFANGTRGAGINAIGPSAYLGVPGLGISGLFTNSFANSDPGQLTAQFVAIIVIAVFSALVYAPLALVSKRIKVPTYAADVSTNDEVLQPGSTAPALAPYPQPVIAQVLEPTDNIPVVETPVIQTSVAAVVSEPPVKKITLLERLRLARLNNKSTPPPTQARHTAYPVRAGGRRISIRPLVHPRQTAPVQESPEKNS
ncbi:MAG TPA: hypothetical protein VGK87_03785 [Anaerolineae bacterium]